MGNPIIIFHFQELFGTEEISEGIKEPFRSDSQTTTKSGGTGTNSQCLEDPVFEFERKKDSPMLVTQPPSSTTQQGYRVLEATPLPQTSIGGNGGGGSTTGTGGYHVLEAPTIGPGSAQRTGTASDVLDAARNRFDKFWGKGSDN